MGAHRKTYRLVARYAKGPDVIYWELEDELGKRKKVTQVQMSFMVGTGQISNVEAQLYKDKVLFRGKGVDIRALPTIQIATNATNDKPTQKTKLTQNNKPIQSKYNFEDLHNKIMKIINEHNQHKDYTEYILDQSKVVKSEYAEYIIVDFRKEYGSVHQLGMKIVITRKYKNNVYISDIKYNIAHKIAANEFKYERNDGCKEEFSELNEEAYKYVLNNVDSILHQLEVLTKYYQEEYNKQKRDTYGIDKLYDEIEKIVAQHADFTKDYGAVYTKNQTRYIQASLEGKHIEQHYSTIKIVVMPDNETNKIIYKAEWRVLIDRKVSSSIKESGEVKKYFNELNEEAAGFILNNIDSLLYQTAELTKQIEYNYRTNIQVDYGKGKANTKEVLIKSSDYDELTQELITKYSNIAYNLEETLILSDAKIDRKLNIDNIINDKYYISFSKWGSDDRDYAVVSKTTFGLLDYEYPEITRVQNKKLNIEESKYKYCHYHELVIKLALFSRIPQYKKLKLKFIKYNKEVFNNKIPSKLVLAVGNYKEGTKFKDLEKCSGYSSKRYNNFYDMIMFNYTYFRTIDEINNLSRQNLGTLLHEMSHAYVDEVYGTSYEGDKENWGDVVYGINYPGYEDQYKFHGKKFGETVQMVADKTGLSFDEIFHYGVHKDNSTRNTEYTTDLYDRVIIPEYNKEADSKYKYTKRNFKHDAFNNYLKLKNTLNNESSQWIMYFKKKFNLDIVFDISDEQTYINVIDQFGQVNKYDINYNHVNLNPKFKNYCILYKIYNSNQAVQLYSFDIDNNENSIIKNIMKQIYKDIQQSA